MLASAWLAQVISRHEPVFLHEPDQPSCSKWN